MRGRSVAVLVLCGVVALGAQNDQPTFEVASVRPNKSGSRSSNAWSYKGETFTITNSPLRTIIRVAYGIDHIFVDPTVSVEGEPSWRDDRYDIVAKTPVPLPIVRSGLQGPGPPLSIM